MRISSIFLIGSLVALTGCPGGDKDSADSETNVTDTDTNESVPQEDTVLTAWTADYDETAGTVTWTAEADGNPGTVELEIIQTGDAAFSYDPATGTCPPTVTCDVWQENHTASFSGDTATIVLTSVQDPEDQVANSTTILETELGQLTVYWKLTAADGSDAGCYVGGDYVDYYASLGCTVIN